MIQTFRFFFKSIDYVPDHFRIFHLSDVLESSFQLVGLNLDADNQNQNDRIYLKFQSYITINFVLNNLLLKFIFWLSINA